MAKPTEIEKQNLEAHVEICAVRYSNLETKIDNLEHRMDKLEGHLVDIKESLTNKVAGQDKQTVSTLVSIFGVILAGLIGFIGHALFK
jgi:predicted  nucleic acid-binding Zn-ribbon protein